MHCAVQVIPVLDLMQGSVVRGVGGRRDEYRPIETRLAADAQPASIADAFHAFGFTTFYQADLDAIQGGPPAWDVYRSLVHRERDLWVDAGTTTLERAQELAAWQHQGHGLGAIVAGLESLSGPALLAEICKVVGSARLIFSLDLKAGMPLVSSDAWRGLTPMEIARIALRCGVRRIIVLDLASVGEGRGVGTQPLCRALRAIDPELQLIAGGGVRGPADLVSLAKCGCDAALVASALHDARLDARACAAMR